jgi:predicted RNase H-like HicB family nuclease
MKKIIKFEIYNDGEFYCTRCLDFDIYTQGKTLDELVQNIREAVTTHFEDEPEELAAYDRNPSLMTIMELGDVYV